MIVVLPVSKSEVNALPFIIIPVVIAGVTSGLGEYVEGPEKSRTGNRFRAMASHQIQHGATAYDRKQPYKSHLKPLLGRFQRFISLQRERSRKIYPDKKNNGYYSDNLKDQFRWPPAFLRSDGLEFSSIA